MKVGDVAETRRTFTADDVAQYERISGHAAGAGVPEPMLGALFSFLLGVELPGKGTNYLKQEWTYSNTASIGQELRARVEVTRLRPGKHLVDLRTSCVCGDSTLLCEGRALVYVGDVQE